MSEFLDVAGDRCATSASVCSKLMTTGFFSFRLFATCCTSSKDFGSMTTTFIFEREVPLFIADCRSMTFDGAAACLLSFSVAVSRVDDSCAFSSTSSNSSISSSLSSASEIPNFPQNFFMNPMPYFPLADIYLVAYCINLIIADKSAPASLFYIENAYFPQKLHIFLQKGTEKPPAKRAALHPIH